MAQHNTTHDDTAHEAHPAHLHHHFETPRQQFESDKLGMWLFLVTEILLFGGLFCAYAVYRANHPEIFIYAHKYLDKTLGGINTLILISSSFTMAWAVRAAQLGQRRLLILLLALTLLGGFGFLGIKAVEYEHKWKSGLLWGARFNPREHAPAEQPGAHGADGAASHGADSTTPPGADGTASSGADGPVRELLEPAPRRPARQRPHPQPRQRPRSPRRVCGGAQQVRRGGAGSARPGAPAGCGRARSAARSAGPAARTYSCSSASTLR